MIEKLISQGVWQQTIEAVASRTDDLPDALGEMSKSPMSNDYIEGSLVGMLSYAEALVRAKRTDLGYIHWLAQQVSRNLIFILHKRGFDPYVTKSEGPTQAEIDDAVREMLKQLSDPPPEPTT
jgi:hypothetical protein